MDGPTYSSKLFRRVIREVKSGLRKKRLRSPKSEKIVRRMDAYGDWTTESTIKDNIRNIVLDFAEKAEPIPPKETSRRKIAPTNSGEAYVIATEIKPLIESIRQKFWGKTDAPFTASPEGHLQALKWLRKAKAEDEAALGNRPWGKHSLTFTVESDNGLDTFMGLSFPLGHLPQEVHEAEAALQSLAKDDNNQPSESRSLVSNVLHRSKMPRIRKQRQQEEKLSEYVTQVHQLISRQFEVPSNASAYFKHVAHNLEHMELKVTDLQVNEVPTFLRLPNGKDAIVSFRVSSGTRLADLAEWVAAVVKLSGWWADHEALAFIMCAKVPVHGVAVEVLGAEDGIPEAITLTIRGPATKDEVSAVYDSVLHEYQLEPQKLNHVYREILRLVYETPGASWPERYKKWQEYRENDKTLSRYASDPKSAYRNLRRVYKERVLEKIGWKRKDEVVKANPTTEFLKALLDFKRGYSIQKLPKNPMDTE